MAEAGATPQPITLEQLPELREKTEKVSDLVAQRLRRHLDALRPVLLPSRTFGRYASTSLREDSTAASDAWARIQEGYRAACGKPFGVQPELEISALQGVDARLEIYPWEVPHEINGPKERRALNIIAPLRWLLTYRSSHSPSQMRQICAGVGERRADAIRDFLLSALAANLVLQRSNGVLQLLADLRYRVAFEKLPGLGELPFTVISAPIATIRPADDVVLASIRLSGVAAFVELLDIDSLTRLEDPFGQEVRALLG